MKTNTLKFRTLLLVPLFLGGVVLSLLFYNYSIVQQEKIFSIGFINNTKNIYETVKLGLEVGLNDENLQTIDKVFNWAKSKNELKWIAIVDSDNEIFATFPDELNLSQEQLEESFLKNNIELEIYVQKGNWSSKIDSGNLYIGFSTDALAKSKEEITKDLMLGSVILLISIAILSIILSFLLTTPLEKLRSVTNQIFNGNMAMRADPNHGGLEIVSVSQSFNLMMNKLDNTQKLLVLEQKKTDDLLLNILPKEVCNRLKSGESDIADSFDCVTVLFADLVGFTELSATMNAHELVKLLNRVFTTFDSLSIKYGIEKIKTIGDCYMAASGLNLESDHAHQMIIFAKEMLQELNHINNELGKNLKLRIGIHSGNLVAGVIGTQKFIYDLWGDTVNLASRMESHGTAGKIAITKECYTLIKDKFSFVDRGLIDVKGKGQIHSYFLGE